MNLALNTDNLNDSFLSKVLRRIGSYFYQWIKYIPGKSGTYFRGISLKLMIAKMGRDVFVQDAVTFANPKHIIIGSRVSIHQGCQILANGILQIDDCVSIAANCVIVAENHNFSDPHKLIKDQGVTPLPIHIQSNCWLAANVTILGGVTIGSGSVIGAGSVVTKDIPENSIAVGIPAKVIKSRT